MRKKSVNWWENPLTECPICKKKFAPAVEHAWKIGNVANSKLVCSYSCMREWERTHTDERKIKPVMFCPKCNDGKPKVVDTVHNAKDNEIYRRRRCLHCGHIFHTVEIIVEEDQKFKDIWWKCHRNNNND